jgi:uracil-DNA glycosylase family 4
MSLIATRTPRLSSWVKRQAGMRHNQACYFVGRAGQWLRQAIRQIGFDEQGVYLTNAVQYLPTDRKRCSNDVAHGRNHLLQQLAIINPRIVVLLGATACRGVLNQKVAVCGSISRDSKGRAG